MIYNVEVNDRIISLISIENEDGETVDSVGGNKGDEVRFTIYGDLSRTTDPIKAAFLWNGKYHLEDVIDIDATQGLFYCYVPPIFNSNNFYLGLYIGEDADEAPYLSTNRVEIPCKLSIRDYIKVPQDSHLGKYTDIVAFNAYRAETAATNSETAAKNAANSEKESRESAKSAYEDAESAKADAGRAESAAERAEQAEANTPYVVQTPGDSVTAVMSQKAVTDELCFEKSKNLYNPALQTPETISPHYFVSGEPYPTTQFDGQYNCAAPIEIEPNTQYTVGLVPVRGEDVVKPWNQASSGLFFYDKNYNYISGVATNTFTTPENARYIRFNYNIYYGLVTLEILNERCMLVKGDTLPTEYEPYYFKTIKNKMGELVTPRAKYNIIENGDGIEITDNYGADTITITLKKKGGNNLFDFEKISKNGVDLISASGDWHAPFVMRAVNNADGDNISSGFFTGGNHQTNNSGSGGAKTARTTSLRYFIDGKEIVSGNGYSNKIEIRWTNLVQGYNTSKADGTGREILQENHTLSFVNGKFYSEVELIPLEDIVVERWYGFQGDIRFYPKNRYIGGTNRMENVGVSDSGNADASHIVCYSDTDEMVIGIDTSYDLGKRTEILDGTKGIFTQSYGKCYFLVINNYATRKQGEHFYLRGTYEFRPK